MATLNDRDYIIGSTIVLRVSTRDPRSRAAVDPVSVNLVALTAGDVHLTLPSTVAFTRVTPGEYALSLATGSLAPGLHTWRAEAVDAAGDVALSEDTFALRPPA